MREELYFLESQGKVPGNGRDRWRGIYGPGSHEERDPYRKQKVGMQEKM